jgi:hypothetical protein
MPGGALRSADELHQQADHVVVDERQNLAELFRACFGSTARV